MSKVDMLRLLINQRMAEVAEEILAVFGSTIAGLERELCRSRREIQRQRRLLQVSFSAAPSEPHDWTVDLNLEDHTPLTVKEEEPQQEDTPPGSEPEVSVFLSGDLEAWPDDVLHSAEDFDPDPQPGTSTQTDRARAGPRRRRKPRSKPMRNHGGKDKADKSYTCGICGKRLTRFDGYQKHLRVHTGEKPYGCDDCGRRFSDYSNYRRHRRKHESQTPQNAVLTHGRHNK
ncbi:zinc finger and SCAN domain-containing protein 21-like isoform X1 [Nerophis ophidion]|uniref:zinc finger and SCAN domain-containing protein 21-like isoform X1 n=1 Tax=Nerophis ophidion TaxID=159077 RepID=UPI002ADFBC59|nr:zinc finger and SCAN domain-containing protein 21-like isoform X1 [Nerophis ophidion]